MKLRLSFLIALIFVPIAALPARAACELANCDTGQALIKGACAVVGGKWQKVCLPKSEKAIAAVKDNTDVYHFLAGPTTVKSSNATHWDQGGVANTEFNPAGVGIMPVLKPASGNPIFIYTGDGYGISKIVYSTNYGSSWMANTSIGATDKWIEWAKISDTKIVMYGYQNNNVAVIEPDQSTVINITAKKLTSMPSGGAKRIACNENNCFIVQERCKYDNINRDFYVYNISMTDLMSSSNVDMTNIGGDLEDKFGTKLVNLTGFATDFASKGRNRLLKYCNGRFLMVPTGSLKGILSTDGGDTWEMVNLPSVTVMNNQGITDCNSSDAHAAYGGYAGLVCWEGGFYLIAADWPAGNIVNQKAFYSKTGETGSWEAAETLPGFVTDVVSSAFYADNFFGFLSSENSSYAYVTTHAGQVVCPENQYLFNDSCTPCPAGTFSPVGSPDISYCGRKLHFGDDMIYLGTSPKTTHFLTVLVGTTPYYGHMSLANESNLKIKIGNDTYSIYGN